MLFSGIFSLSVTYNSLDLDQLCLPMKGTSRAVLCEPVLHTQREWLDQELPRVSLKDILNIVLRMNTDIAMIWFHHLALY